jgi:hypothetical protein
MICIVGQSKRLKKYEKAERERVRNDQAAAEQLKKEQDYKIFIMSLIKRYNLPEDTLFKSADDVAEMLAHKSKYLFLARYLAKNRGDWTDGYSYAQQGLDEFDIGPTPIDKEIVEEISGLIRNWDGDGRVFRDCEWNYDRIFAHVAEIMPELYADYCKIHEMESFV